jgi:phosphoglucosamine mutase
MKNLFGTDGIRGPAGEFPLDARTVFIIGASVARQFTERLGRAPRLISGRDTRESGAWIEAALLSGAASEGAVCESAGVITTPGVAYLTSAFDFDSGIVISASHNPYADNGIKIFSPSGKKLDDAAERAIEKDIEKEASEPNDLSTSPRTSSQRSSEFCQSYLEHLRRVAGGISAEGLRIVVDCAHGASSFLAPRLFAGTGAEVITINNLPDGRNINRDCGSLHLDVLQARVLEERADLGVAFDGDADRALFVDETGREVDGDATLWIMARQLKDEGELRNNRVVATVMSNIGLELALASKGIELTRTSVGDKYVLEELLRSDSEIGGEQSGHIIFPKISLVGDGMMTALLLLHSITERKQRLSEAVRGFTRYPQVLVNVKVREKRPFEQVPAIASASEAVRVELDGNGRLLLRYSGTENLARVMIEGKEQSRIEEQARRLASVIEQVLA